MHTNISYSILFYAASFSTHSFINFIYLEWKNPTRNYPSTPFGGHKQTRAFDNLAIETFSHMFLEMKRLWS